MVYSYYNRPPKVKLVCPEETRTRQSERDACDVNKIMARFEKTGLLPVDGRDAYFANVSQMGDFREAMEHVRLGERFFSQMPAAVRSRFDNDPAAFLDFVADPENEAELRSMGLLERRVPEKASEEPEIPPVEVE